MNQLARFNVRTGEADDLAVLVKGLSFADCLQGHLVSHADALAHGDGAGAVDNLHSLGKGPGGDGQVIFRPQVNRNLLQRHSWHEKLLKALALAAVTIPRLTGDRNARNTRPDSESVGNSPIVFVLLDCARPPWPVLPIQVALCR